MKIPTRISRRLLGAFLALGLATSLAATPTITSQPTGGAIASGNTASFGVAATGTGTLSYQWQKDGAPLADGTFVLGATTATLTLTNPQVADAGAYAVVVTDAADAQSVTSATAALAVTNQPPVITAQSPAEVFTTSGGAGNARLFVNFAGSTPITMQWRRDGVALNGPFTGTNVSLVDLFGVTPERAGIYQLEASNAFGSVVSDPIAVSVGLYEPTETWSFVHPGPQGNLLNALAFGPGRAYAVGNGGTVLTSTDGGATWTDASASFPRTHQPLNSALYDPASNQFILGGGFTQLFTAPANGDPFTNRAPAPPANESYNGLARDPASGRLVAVGGDFTTRPTRALARVSTDGGVTWTQSLPGPTNAILNSVAFGTARFVAVGPGGSGNNVLHSADGLAWSPATLTPAADQTFRRVAFANGQFVAVGDGGVLYTSSDGQNFTQRASGTTQTLRGVALLSGAGATAEWTAVGFGRTVLTSTDDAATWTASPATGGVLENFPNLALLDVQTDGTSAFVIAPAGRLLRSTTLAGFTAASLADVGFSVQTNYTAPFNDVIWDAPTSHYFAAASQGNIHTSPDGFTWSRAADLPGAFDFMPGIARFNSQLLVTGFKRVATSPDGATWTEQPEIAGAAGSLWGLAASATRAVAVGNGGTIATSTDGVSWTTATSGTASDFRAVAHGNNRFVAVGGNDSGGTSIVIRTSDDDGQTWTARDPGTTGQLWGIDYGDGVWIAAGSRNVNGGDAFILRSFDQGATWEHSDLPGTGFTFRLRHLNGVWYAVGFPGTLAVSRDRGETWDYIPLPARPNPATLRGIAVKTTYPANAVIVGNDSTILVSGGESPNAPVLIRHPSANFAPAGGDVEFAAAALNTLGATYQWRKNGNPIAGATSPSLRLANVQPANAAAYDVVITNPNTAAATSAPAALVVGPAVDDTLPNFAWRNPLPAGGTLLPVIHALGKFIAAGVGGRVLTSPDGVAWSPAADLAFEQANGLATDGTTVVLVGGGGRIFTSPDATTWTQRGTQQQFNFRWFNAAAFADGQFVAVGDQGLIATSADSGATWTVRASGTTQRLTGVAGTTGRFVAVGEGGALLTSTDAATWTPGTAPGSHATAPFQGAAFLNGQFILAAGNAAPLTSPDGLAWTARPTGFGDWIHRIGFTGTHYVATLSGGSAVLRSADLATWERVAFASAQPGAATFFGVAAGGGTTVLVGAGGELRSSTDHGATWTSRGAEGGVQILNEVRALPDGEGFLAVGSTGTVLASDDGTVWRRLNTNIGHWLSSVSTGLGRVILTTLFGDILTTVNGDFFESRTVGDNFPNWGSVFTNGKFVVVGDQGRVRVSTDGLNWTTTQLPGVTTNLRSVAARGDLVVIVADNGRIFSSTDFTTWTERTSGTTWHLNRVRALDGVFLAVGDNRTALFSTDGVAWTALPVPNDFNNLGFAFRDIVKLHDGYYVASSEGKVVKTADLRTWTKVAQVAHQTRLMSLATDGARLVVAGEGGALLSAAHPGVADAPAFVTGLPAQTLFANNATVQLSVFATGAGPLAYQWSKAGAPLAGATGPLLTLPATTAATAGSYTVTVTTALGQTATSTTELAVAGLPTGSGPLFGVGDLPGGIVLSQIRDATKVGGVIHAVGNSAANPGSTFSGDTAIAWSSTDGLTVLPSLVPGATGTNFVTASAITPDAAFIAARARPDNFGLRQAVRVDRAGLTNLSFANLGGFTGVSAANVISDDGAILYGFGVNGDGQNQAVRFTAAGPTAQAIPFLNPGDASSLPAGGRGTSSDGAVMVGWSGSDTTQHAFRYVQGTGVTAIPELAGGTWSAALAVSTDGNLALVAGDSPAAPKGELYLHDAVTGALTPLGTPNAAWSPSNIAGMTGDGAVAVVAFSVFNASDEGGTFESISYFHNAHGWFPLATALATLPGADLTGWDLDSALGISRDGTLIFGSGLHAGATEGFVAEFPAGFLAAFNPPETIVTQPASQTVTSGGAVTLSVTVADPAQVTFQWRKDGVPLAGATGASLTLSNLTAANAGSYTVVITGPNGTTTSEPAVLAVNVPIGSGPLFGVGDLPGGLVFSEIRDATKVGGVIYAVGTSTANSTSADPDDFDGFSDTAIIWSSTDGLAVLPNLVTNTTATGFRTASAITPDAAFIASRARAATVGDFVQAVRVDRASLTNLNLDGSNQFPAGSEATSISDDGSILYGVRVNGAGQDQAVRFTAAGPAAQLIPFLNPGDSSSTPASARGTSSDGTVMVGYSGSTTEHAFRYVHGTGVTAIPELAGGTWSIARAVSADGNLTLVAGDSTAAPNGEFYLHDATTGALTPLGTPNPAWSPDDRAGLTGDGAVVVALFASDAGESISYFHNAHGWFPLATALATLPGADLTGWDLNHSFGVSRDGTLVFGAGLHNGATEGFVAEFPAGFLAAFNPPETIVTQPASQTVTSGGAVTLSVTVADPAQVTFQWRKDGVPLAGATGASLPLANVTRADAGRYEVVITASGGGTVTSAAAVLAVAPTAFPGQLAYDPTFNPGLLSNSTRIYTALALPDGQWMVGGDFVRWDGTPRAFLARLNADLSLDATFTPPLINGFVFALARDAAGRLYVGGEFTQVDGHGFPGLFRLGAAGALDLTWFPDDDPPAATVSALATQADGKLLVARQATLAGQTVTAGTQVLRRLQADGTLDPSFTVDLTVNGQRLYAIVAQPDGAIAFAGRFTAVNGAARFGLARVSATGVLDQGFGGATGVGSDLAVFDLTRLPDGKYLAAGAFGQLAGTARSRVALLNADGTLDPSFDPVALTGNVNAAARLADGRIIVGGTITSAGGAATHGFVRLTATGAVDQLFTAGATVTTPATTTLGRSLHLFPRTDGTTAVFGTFQSILDARRTNVAVLTAVGGLAPSPAPALLRPAFTGSAYAVAGGRTAVFGGIDVAGAAATVAHHALRLNDDGSRDATFPAGSGFGLNGLSTFGLFRAVRQGDGKFVAVGDIAAVNGNAVSRIARIDAAGAFDASFNGGSGPSSFFPAITAISGARTLLHNGGTNFTFNGSAAARMFRLAADGARDTTLVLKAASPSTAGFSFVHEQPDGRMIVLGSVTTYDGNPVNGLFRMLPDGAFDPLFTPGSGPAGGSITSVTGLADGRLVIAGAFTSYAGQPASRVAVLSSDGVLDPSFHAPAELDGLVGQVLPQEDGKLIVVGDFTGTPVRGVARLHANGTLDTSFGLHGITGGFSSASRLVMGDDGSIYVHAGNPVSFNGGVPVAFARFRGAPVAPTIAVAPAGATATIGSPAVLAVRVVGTGPFTYQWRKDGVAIADATNSFIATSSLELADAGSYDVVVTGPGGTVTSAPAVLAVTGVPPVMQDQPVSRRVVAGGNVQFRAFASGTPPLTYQWRKDGADLPGATGSDLWLGPVAPADAGAYTVRVANSGGAVISAAANLTVLPADPVLWQQFTELSGQQAPARLFSDGAGSLYASWAVQDRSPDVAGGRLIGAVARFSEATGVLDPAFQLDRRIRSAGPVVRLGNGQLLVSTRAGDASTVIRVSAAGVVDATFTAPLFARAIRFLALQPDGKVLVAVTDNLGANAPAGALAAAAPGLHRLNANGTVDAGFTPALLNATGNLFAPPVVDASGRIYLAGAFGTVNGTARTNVARLAANGALDPAFAATLPAGFASSQARGVGLQTGGRAVFVGGFSHTARGTGGDPVMAIRFNADGTFDSTFAQPLRSELGLNPAVAFRLRHLVMQPDDKIVAVSDRLVRLNADGSRDATFTSHAFANEAFWVARAGDGRLFVPDVRGVFGASLEQPLWANGIAAFAADGTPDPSFQTGGFGRADYPTSGRVLADGTVLQAGAFNRFGATPLPAVARFTAPGALAPAQVAPPAGSPDNFRSLPHAALAAAAGDQTYVVWSSDEDAGGAFYAALRRLNADGTDDATFNPVLPAGYDLGTAGPRAAPAGRLLLAQGFVAPQVALAGGTGDALLRLNADGSRDTGFNPGLASFAAVDRAAGTNAVTLIRTGGLNVAQVLPDGRILLVVSAIDGNLRLQRLHADGTLDATFNAPSFGTITPDAGFTTSLTDPVTSVTAQFPLQTFSAADLVRTAVQLPDGKVYVGGRFALAGAPRGLARLNADGTLDATFTGAGLATTATDAGPYVDALAVDSSGRLYVAGRFTSFNGAAVPGLFRLAANGTLDTAWAPGFGLRDVPEAAARLVIANDRLHVFGTPGNAGEALPQPYRFVDIPPSNQPLLLTQPASVAVADGDLAVLSVSVFGPGPFTFQWARDGVPVAGATGATLTVDPVTAATAGSYTVAVTGPLGGTIVSAPAVVSVTPSAPGFDPAGNLFGDFGDVVAAGTNAAIHAEPSFGSTPITYQWRFNGADLPGATDASLFLANWQPADAGLYSVRATNAQGATTSPAEPFYVQPEGGWRWRNPLPTGNGLTFVRFLNGQFFAGGLRGTLFTSADGATWTPRAVPATNNLLGLQLLNGRFVLLGSLNAAYTSSDGLAWTPREIPLNGVLTQLQDLMAGGGQVVAVGTGGLTARSSDGLAWTVGTLAPGVTETVLGGGFILNRFYAVGTETGRVYSSADGATWTTANTPATTGLLGLAQGAGRFVAVGVGGAIVTSTDAVNWTTVVSPATLDLNNVAFVNNRFVATGDLGTLFTSTDGLTWTARSTGGNQSSLLESAFGNGVHVVIGQAGNTGRTLLTSPDATTWTSRITGPRQGGGLLGLATNGTTLVAVGRDFTGDAFALSTADAATWTDRAAGTTQPRRAVAYAAGQFVAVGDASVVTTSADGATWSVAATTGLAGATLRGISHDGAQWLAVGDGGGLFTSADASTWTARAVPTTAAVNQLAFAGGTYAAVTGAGEILTSSDAANWSTRVAAGGPALRALAHGAGTFVAVGNGGAAFTSPDGATWTPRRFTTTSLVSINFLHGAFLATSASHRTYVSTDGINWTGRTTGAFDALRATAEFAGQIVGVGDFGTILTAGAPVVAGPASLMVNSGGPATLRAAVSASPFPVSYVWSKDGAPLAGGPDSPILTLPAAGPGDVGAYTLAATNAFGTTTSAAANLTLNVGVALTAQPQPQTVLVGGTATFSVTATGDPAPTYQWRLNGAILPGANAATLTLTNVQPANAGAYTVVVANPGGAVTSADAVLTVNPVAPVITSAATALAVVNQPFSYRITTNQTAVAAFTATGLPAGLSFNAATGVISGTPTVTGSFTVALGAGNVTGSASLSLALTIAPPPPVITSPASAAGRVGVAFTYTITATNTPTGFLATGLPAGLALNATTGAITGAPTVAGAFNVALAAQNATGANALVLALTVAPPLNAPVYSGPTLISRTAGAAFTFTPNFGAGVTGFALVNLPGGATSVLPAGLALDPVTGVISGTPTQPGVFSVALQATNPDGVATAVLTFTINPAPSAPLFTSAGSVVGTVGAPFSFTLTTSPAATSFGSTALPAGLGLNPATGGISGTPTAPGLATVGVTATNANGTALGTLSFTINASALAPVLTNFPVAVGRVGAPLTFALTATNAPEQFVVVTGTLPPGLGLAAGTGLITGTPTASGQRRVWFAAGNTAGGRGPAMEMLFDIGAPLNVPVITSNGTAAGTVGQPFAYQVTATNAPTSFAATPPPPGLSLDPATGALTGVPQAETATPFFVALTAANGDGTSLPKLLAISVAPAPATPRITSPATAGGRVGVAFSYQTAASEQPTSFAAGPLPAGLALDPVSGLISGTPTAAGAFVVPLRAGNAAGQGQALNVTFTLAAALEAPRITSASSATGRVGQAFSYQIVATGTPTSYAVAGDLPLGLVLNTATGVISGNPADDPDLYEVALTATNASGTSQPQTLLLAIFPADNVPVITSPVSATGRVGQAFSYQITATNVPGTTPFPASTFLDAVGLPAGLAVNPSTGLIQGTPSATGVFTVLLVGVNENGFGLPRVLTVTINPAPSAPVVTSPAATSAQVGQGFTYQITATNLPTAFEALDAPAWLSVDTATGLLVGVPVAPGPLVLRLRAANAGGESALAPLTVAIAAAAGTPVITSPQAVLGQVGAGFSFQLTATNTPTTFEATGLPAGLVLNATTGAITGTPQVSGSFAVTVSATNANGPGQPVILTLTLNPSTQLIGG